MGLLAFALAVALATPPPVSAAGAAPAAGAVIVDFWASGTKSRPLPVSSGRLEPDPADTTGPGPLHIRYSDGTETIIPNERGTFSDGDKPVAQEAFEQIRVAPDRQTIGWLASYRMCSQAYACPLKLVIYRTGRVVRSFDASHGVFWGWKFQKRGGQVVTLSGFPHGREAGSVAAYDVETGRPVKRTRG